MDSCSETDQCQRREDEEQAACANEYRKRKQEHAARRADDDPEEGKDEPRDAHEGGTENFDRYGCRGVSVLGVGKRNRYADDKGSDDERATPPTNVIARRRFSPRSSFHSGRSLGASAQSGFSVAESSVLAAVGRLRAQPGLTVMPCHATTGNAGRRGTRRRMSRAPEHEKARA
jgi:hypothetical protein